MVHFIRTAFFLFIFSGVQAQFIPNSAQPFQFASAYNPSFSGVENFADLKLSYRYQWSSLGANAPRFINLAYNFRLKQPLDLSSNTLRGSNVSALNADKLPKSKRIIHGFGANFFNEHVGQVERIGGGINYAFNYPLTKKIRMSIGAAAIIENSKIDLNAIELRDADPFYDQLVANGTTETNLNVRTGIAFYSPSFYLGASYFPVLNYAIQASDASSSQIFYKGSIQGGFSIPVSSNGFIRPSVLALWQMDNKMSIDYSVKTYIQNKVWLGLTYRDVKSGVFLFGLNVNELISVSYSYEMALSDYSKFGGSSHDLVLSFRLNNFRHQNQYMW
ncbi:MAG: PorP/SprF family type IX secretion system membrane protein [Chryseolinea sp.]